MKGVRGPIYNQDGNHEKANGSQTVPIATHVYYFISRPTGEIASSPNIITTEANPSIVQNKSFLSLPTPLTRRYLPSP